MLDYCVNGYVCFNPRNLGCALIIVPNHDLMDSVVNLVRKRIYNQGWGFTAGEDIYSAGLIARPVRFKDGLEKLVGVAAIAVGVPLTEKKGKKDVSKLRPRLIVGVEAMEDLTSPSGQIRAGVTKDFMDRLEGLVLGNLY